MTFQCVSVTLAVLGSALLLITLEKSSGGNFRSGSVLLWNPGLEHSIPCLIHIRFVLHCTS